jgi:hypothetical protein
MTVADMPRLAGQVFAEFGDQSLAVLLASMGEMEIDHGGVDMAVAHEFFDQV